MAKRVLIMCTGNLAGTMPELRRGTTQEQTDKDAWHFSLNETPSSPLTTQLSKNHPQDVSGR